MQLSEIHERVQALMGEIAVLRLANQVYLSKHLHSPLETFAHRQRGLRLQQIIDELGLLTKRKFD